VESLEQQIAEWRTYLGSSRAVDGRDLEELEAHLRDEIEDLGRAGLAGDEAFLVAVKRMGSVDALSREFAREHSERLWKQLVVNGEADSEGQPNSLSQALVFAVLAAVAIHIPRLAGPLSGDGDLGPVFLRNAGLLVLSFLAWYYVRRNDLSRRQAIVTAAPFVVAAALVNLYPWEGEAGTLILAAAHLPVVLWFAVGYPYTGAAWRSHDRRMDFVRFTGEWFIYFVLIALGGGVLVGLSVLILEPVSATIAETLIEWMVFSGAAGAAIVAAWLVEGKKGVVENMAPVLTKVFTPLFAVMLAGSAVTYALTGLAQDFDRELLAVFDALLVVVLGLVLYGMSAREPSQAADLMDRVQLVAVGSALVLDMMVLWAMIARIGELGFTPNRVAALGLNLVLLVNLVGAAWLSWRFLTGRVPFHTLERWQMAYLPVFGLWAAAVVVVLPPVFSFG
jgi:hypothetical protein